MKKIIFCVICGAIGAYLYSKSIFVVVGIISISIILFFLWCLYCACTKNGSKLAFKKYLRSYGVYTNLPDAFLNECIDECRHVSKAWGGGVADFNDSLKAKAASISRILNDGQPYAYYDEGVAEQMRKHGIIH